MSNSIIIKKKIKKFNKKLHVSGDKSIKYKMGFIFIFSKWVYQKQKIY